MTSQIYIVIVKVAVESQVQSVIHATAQTFHLLINGEVEGLLDNKLFSRSLLDLVRYTVLRPQFVVDDITESSLIELLFEIATKIRLDPDILPAWFYPERDKSQARGAGGETRRNQFPLFYVLVQYVHSDGPVGDFARTGLLYLTETASRSNSLETWMIESDLAPQMASGLGALYSRLSRHFPPLEQSEKALPILALSDPSDSDGSTKETRENFQQNTKEFLSYLAFWQDTLNHCKSAEVAETLLDHFQVLFVQQLLYPSLLESSDVAGGSTAAVLAHLAKTLTALDHRVLAQRLLGYLLNSSQHQSAKNKHRARPSISRRKSLEHLAALAEIAQSPSPALFSLHDLVQLSLRSTHPNTVNACLKLLSVILDKHHPCALTGLFRTESLDTSKADHSVKTFNDNLIKCFDLAMPAGLEDTLDEAYEGALVDAKVRLERHSCMMQSFENDKPLSPTTAIAADCKLIRSLNAVLQRFFLNDTLTNLLLTESVMSLAACENISLGGWLLPHANDHDHSPSLLRTLEGLSDQVKTWRKLYAEWDMLIEQRRLDLVENEPILASDARSTLGPTRGVGIGTPERSTGTPLQQNSRPTTPRGQSIPAPKFGSIDGNLSASPSSPSNVTPRPLAGSPLRKTYMPSFADRIQSLSDRSVSSLVPASATLQELVAIQEALLATQVYAETRSNAVSVAVGEDLSSINDLSLAVVDDTSDVAIRQPTEGMAQPESASLSHILTNAIVLQEFILEIAAVVQVRGTMFGEVDLQS